MPQIKLSTTIQAERNIVFDLSRSIDLHKISTQHTNEKAIAGRTEGLIEMGESVTWRAKHFGFYQKLRTEITEFERPNYFTDEMVSGAFTKFKHEHHFIASGNRTEMTDYFDYESPFGIIGRLVDKMLLKKYMTELLKKRNQTIKEFAESEKWKEIIK
ncbi:SRPBCC family protein [Marivirga sp.]|uniref:SRPBCC family protein n=1 Tax=Marivirga sp. TaxID=2018662 RepID=UPI002D809F8F|nr:SRPBCC family protein [Marivirga sp.]HET8860623.1 SRPBCC family protein [Marivirga sp.]